nr:ORF2 [Epsilontorquevirus sp.]
MPETRKEQAWLGLTRQAHSLFCNCGDWFHHLLSAHGQYEREIQVWLTGGEGDTAADRAEEPGDEPTADGGDRVDDGHGSAMEDAAFAAAAEDAEEQERSDSENCTGDPGPGC